MNRLASYLVPGALALAGVFSFHLEGAAQAADVCIDSKAANALNACANGGPASFDVSTHGKAPKVNFQSAPPPRELKKRDQQTKPGNPNLEMGAAQRDDRKTRLQARAKALLVTEINGLENLFRTTDKTSSDRPQLARRLAEDYVELEASAFKAKTQAEVDRDNLKKTNPNAAGQKQAEANAADNIMKAARNNAIKNYTLLKTDYPNYSQLDEVLYYLAYEYEQASDLSNARKVYYELIQQRPNSKYIANAYLAFGELFFNEAQGDPSKWDSAEKAYIEVVKYPPPNNKVYGYAFYKLAYVFWNKGELDKALDAFKKTIDYGVTYSQLPNASKLADSARRDIIPVYALRAPPEGAYNFFKQIAAGGTQENTFKMMDDLGQNYLDTGHYPEAITLYKDLTIRDRNGNKGCEYQAHVTEAVLAMKSGNKEAIKNELENQIKIYNDYKNGNHAADAKQVCANKSAELVAETAMAWHLEAVGSQGQRGTGDQKTMTLAALLYNKVTDTWNAQEFSGFTFPRIVKEDWPTIYKIKYAKADLLYFQEKWDQCGPAFDSVVAEDPKAPEAAEAAYASVLCYQKIYDNQHKGGAALRGRGDLPGQDDKKKKPSQNSDDAYRPKEFTEVQKGMLSAFNRYICFIHPSDKDTTGQDQLVEVKYARARTYFEAQHWDESATAFKDIALTNSDKDAGIYAAQLYLESANVLASHTNPARTACFDDMAADVPKFLELYCGPAKAQQNQDQCLILTRIQVDILRLKAEKLVQVAATQSGAAALTSYESGANAYRDMYDKYCKAPMDAGQKPAAEKCDEILYNAAEAYQSGRLVAKAIRERTRLLAGFPDSPLAKKATYKIGGNYQAIAVYDQAAEWYEKYAKLDKNAEKADSALSDAVLLRLGLGQETEAIADADLFNRNYGGSKPVQAAAVAFAIGAHYVEKEEWDKAKTALQKSMSLIDKAPLDIQAQAHAMLGRTFTHVKGGDPKGEYAKVRALWADANQAVSKIAAAYPNENEAQRLLRVRRALDSVGESYFFAAEEMKKEQVDTIKFPEYKGNGTKEEVLKHINTKVADWLKKKVPAIEKVDAEYRKIALLEPHDPPEVQPAKWVIAAGSRAGLMWGQLVDEFRSAPIPKEWKNDDEIRNTYYSALDTKSEPIKIGKAKPALETCLKYSVKFQYFDEFSRACEVWLAKNYKAEYHVVDELRGAPTLSNSGLEEKTPPLLTTGQFWHPPVQGGPEKAADTGAKDDKATPPAGGGKKK